MADTAAADGCCRRRLFRCAGSVLLLAAVVGCDPASAPLYQYEGGLRVAAGGQLDVWLGADCPAVSAVEVQLNDSDDRPTDVWRVEAASGGARLSSFRLGTVPPGFTQTDPLKGEWRSADTLRIRVETGASRTSSYAAVDSFLLEADSRAADEVFVQDQGWTSSAGYRDLVAEKAVYPLCEPSGD